MAQYQEFLGESFDRLDEYLGTLRANQNSTEPTAEPTEGEEQ